MWFCNWILFKKSLFSFTVFPKHIIVSCLIFNGLDFVALVTVKVDDKPLGVVLISWRGFDSQKWCLFSFKSL